MRDLNGSRHAVPTLPAYRRGLIAVAAVLAPLLCASAALAELASQWVDSYNSRARLIAGTEGGKIHVGVVIEMADGWKTYWRNPGDSGGVPPSFDWAASANLQSAAVSYPAPYRLKEPAGDAIGYKGRVVFPARIVAAKPEQPVRLELKLEFGICKEICVPVESVLRLEIPPNAGTALPAHLAAALERVPRSGALRRATDPKVVRTKAVLDGDTPGLELEVEFAGDGGDAFLEAPDGIYVPQPQSKGGAQGARRLFVVDLATGVDPKDLHGKTLMLTLTGPAGHTQQPWPID